jgi:hypothetical protein
VDIIPGGRAAGFAHGRHYISAQYIQAGDYNTGMVSPAYGARSGAAVCDWACNQFNSVWSPQPYENDDGFVVTPRLKTP